MCGRRIAGAPAISNPGRAAEFEFEIVIERGAAPLRPAEFELESEIVIDRGAAASPAAELELELVIERER